MKLIKIITFEKCTIKQYARKALIMSITSFKKESTQKFQLKSYLTLGSCILIANILFPSIVFAQGVSAGIDILNQVVVTYSINGKLQSPLESSPAGNRLPGIGNGQPTVFKVDRKIDLSLISNGNLNVTLGQTQAELSYTLKNDGNDIQEFLLSADSTIAGDNFDTSNCKIIITAVTGTPLSGVALPSYNKIKLQQDQEASISVKCDIPLTNNGGAILVNHLSTLSLMAVATKNADGGTTTQETTADTTENIETVFADSTGTDDGNRDASHSARANYIALSSTVVSPPTLIINKSIVSVQDPHGGNTAITGSEVTYKIEILTTGSGIIKDVVITDPTPAEMTYKTNTILLNSNTLTDISDSDNGEFNSLSNLSTINLGDITAGSQHEIKLTYTIN